MVEERAKPPETTLESVRNGGLTCVSGESRGTWDSTELVSRGRWRVALVCELSRRACTYGASSSSRSSVSLTRYLGLRSRFWRSLGDARQEERHAENRWARGRWGQEARTLGKGPSEEAAIGPEAGGLRAGHPGQQLERGAPRAEGRTPVWDVLPSQLKVSLQCHQTSTPPWLPHTQAVTLSCRTALPRPPPHRPGPALLSRAPVRASMGPRVAEAPVPCTPERPGCRERTQFSHHTAWWVGFWSSCRPSGPPRPVGTPLQSPRRGGGRGMLPAGGPG